MQHLRWEKTGRTLQGDQPNQFVWNGEVGQVHIDNGGGIFSPYVWDVANKKARFGDCDLTWGAGGLEFRYRGNLLFTGRLNLEFYQGNQWRRRVPTVSGLRIVEVDDLGPTKKIGISYDLESVENKTTFTILVGCSHNVHFTFYTKAKVSGDHRLVFDGLPVGTEIKGALRSNPSDLKTLGVDFGGHAMRWQFNEAPDHVPADLTIAPKIQIAQGTYSQDQRKVVSPTTWGPTAVAADADDGSEYSAGNSGSYAGTWASAGLYGTGLYQERNTATSGNLEKVAAWRWLPVITGTVTSVDAGTQIVFTNNGDNGTPTHITSTLVADNAANAPVWGSGTARPSQRTATAASVNMTGAAGNQTISVQAIVSEKIVTEGNPYSGTQGMAFWAYVTSNQETDYWGISNEYGHGGTLATLAIVYTVAATTLSIWKSECVGSDGKLG